MPTGVIEQVIGGRGPGSKKISDFMADQQGVDDVTTSTITMLHNRDTVTLTNPYPNVTAYFLVKTVETRSKLTLEGWKSQPSSTRTEDKVLNTGETFTRTVREGKVDTFTRVNQDIYIMLIKTDEVKTDGKTETRFVLPGANLFRWDVAWAMDFYRPLKILKRVRERRLIVGPLDQENMKPDILLERSEREEFMDMVKHGKVTNPVQAVMIRSAYAYTDTRRWKEDLQDNLRPY